jgi:hypothetical protein
MVTNGDRVAAAQIRLGQAERLMEEAKRILTYATRQRQVGQEGIRGHDTETGGTRSLSDGPGPVTSLNEPINGIYAGQIPDEVYIDEEDTEECDT